VAKDQPIASQAIAECWQCGAADRYKSKGNYSMIKKYRQFKWSWQCTICDRRSNYMILDSAGGKADRHVCDETVKDDQDD
jgi:hypothetical protein